MRNKATFVFTALMLALLLPPKVGLATCDVLYIDAEGRTGTEIGQVLGQKIKSRHPKIEQIMDSYLSWVIPDQRTFDFGVVPRVQAVRPNIAQRLRDEINGLASGLALSGADALGDGDLSSNELWALQLLPDVIRNTNCSGFGVFGEHTVSGSPIVGRNLDWPTTEAIREIQAVTVYEYREKTLVNIGFAGFVGTLTGFNEAGLFAGILDSPMGGAYPDPPTGKRSYVFDLRDALETCTSIPDAANLLYQQPYAYSHNILLVDGTDVRVLEHPQGVSGMMRTAGSLLHNDLSWGKTNQVAVVNFFALPGYANGRTSFNVVRWNRLKELATFNPANKATVKDVQSVMLDTEHFPSSLFNPQTVQSVVFTQSNKGLYLYTVPASGTHPSDPAMTRVKIVTFSRGDINDDGNTDLADALLALQVQAGVEPSGIRPDYPSSGADIDGDKRIGIQEVVYILGRIAGVR